ncbi:MAG: hypothetical protein ACFB0C_11835 [Leptolyngbyaceae cyanobacterium]
MNRSIPQRPIPFVPMTETGSGIVTQSARPQLKAKWDQVNGQLTCRWIAE